MAELLPVKQQRVQRKASSERDEEQKRVWHVDGLQIISAFSRLTLMCSGGIQGLKREAGFETFPEAGGRIVERNDHSLLAQWFNLLITLPPQLRHLGIDFFLVITVVPQMPLSRKKQKTKHHSTIFPSARTK